jgi:hypothetical protein
MFRKSDKKAKEIDKEKINKIINKINDSKQGLEEIKNGVKILGDGAKLMGDGIKSISNGISTLLAGNVDVSKLQSLDCAKNYFTFSASGDAYLNYTDVLASSKNPVNPEDLKITFAEVQPSKRVENMSWLQAWDVKNNTDNSTSTFYTKSYLIMVNAKISDIKRNVSTMVQIPVALPNGFSKTADDAKLEYDEADMIYRVLFDPENPNHVQLAIKEFSQFLSDDKITGVLIKANAILLTTIPKK